MKYIRIKNTGEIDPKALHLVGASTKRNDTTKIGQFGSGNKYAMAYLLRNEYELKIFSGLREISVHTEKEEFRNQDFSIIFIDNEKTSITTEMGKDWEFWQSIREIYCNALDEGGCTMDFVQEFEPSEGETHFYIDTKKDVFEFMSNFDNYFATKKKVLFECKEGQILEKTGEHANIYRKGIKCYNTEKTSSFDYSFNNIDVDENRLVKYSWELDSKIWNLIFQCDNEEVIKKVLYNCGEGDFIEGVMSDFSTINSSKISETFKSILKQTNIAPLGYAGLLKPDELHNHVLLPTKVFKSVRDVVSDNNVGDRFKLTKKGYMFRILDEVSDSMESVLSKAKWFLNECDFPIDYDIRIVSFDDKNVLGAGYDDTILLSELCLESGVNLVVETIIEENNHLKYNVLDETRAFQDAIIKEFVSYMKKVNSITL